MIQHKEKLSPNEQRIFDDVSSKKVSPSSAISRHAKFRKVYSAPGYPIDPRSAKARSLDSYVNAFAPQPSNTFDRRPLNAWLVANMN